MISFLINPRYNAFWFIFHLFLALISVTTNIGLILWVYVVLLSSIPALLSKTDYVFSTNLLFLIAYIAPFELFARMVVTHPWIPYEFSKYLLLFLFIFAGIRLRLFKLVGITLVMLLIPALFYDFSGEVEFSGIVFNFLGPLDTALAIMIFGALKITREWFVKSLKLLLYPLFLVLIFTLIKTPTLSDIEFKLGAMSDTSAGFGSNQVATVLGLGLFIVFVFWILRAHLTGNKILDLLLMFAFAISGLLTFSRGGMMGGGLGVLLFLLVLNKKSMIDYFPDTLRKTGKLVIPAILIFILMFAIANNITQGTLGLRYQGETEGTLSGQREKNFNLFTTNRFEIASQDFELWKEYPITGVGVGASRYMRQLNIVSHTEFSRLMSEHGVLGIIFIIVLLLAARKHYLRSFDKLVGSIQFILFIVAVFTTFHAAMRTFVSPLLIGLSFLVIIPQKQTYKETT